MRTVPEANRLRRAASEAGGIQAGSWRPGELAAGRRGLSVTRDPGAGMGLKRATVGSWIVMLLPVRPSQYRAESRAVIGVPTTGPGTLEEKSWKGVAFRFSVSYTSLSEW